MADIGEAGIRLVMQTALADCTLEDANCPPEMPVFLKIRGNCTKDAVKSTGIFSAETESDRIHPEYGD